MLKKLSKVQNELKAPKGQLKTEHDLIEYIRKCFKYNEDGTISRTDRKNSNGSYDKDGYLILKIKGKQYKAHRVVYALFNGHFPKGEIDHINRIRDDNRIENLRVVTRIENIQNTTKVPNWQTGVVGVYVDNTKGLKKKYATKLNGKTHRYYSIKEAVEKRREYYGN